MSAHYRQPPVVPGYDVDSLIARGSSATVWAATSASGEGDLAIKVVPVVNQADPLLHSDKPGRPHRLPSPALGTDVLHGLLLGEAPLFWWVVLGHGLTFCRGSSGGTAYGCLHIHPMHMACQWQLFNSKRLRFAAGGAGTGTHFRGIFRQCPDSSKRGHGRQWMGVELDSE